VKRVPLFLYQGQNLLAKVAAGQYPLRINIEDVSEHDL